jgi:hypothetical protein
MVQLANSYAYIIRKATHGRQHELSQRESEILRRTRLAHDTYRWDLPIIAEVQPPNRQAIQAQVRAQNAVGQNAVGQNNAAEQAGLDQVRGQIDTLEARIAALGNNSHPQEKRLLETQWGHLKAYIIEKLNEKLYLAHERGDQEAQQAIQAQIKSLIEADVDKMLGKTSRKSLLSSAWDLVSDTFKCIGSFCSGRGKKGGFTRKNKRLPLKHKKRARTFRLKN